MGSLLLTGFCTYVCENADAMLQAGAPPAACTIFGSARLPKLLLR
jgi:hypothetical protein